MALWHRLQSAWGERVTPAQMPMQVLGTGAPILPTQGLEGTITAHPALSTGVVAPTLLPIHHAGGPALSHFYYNICIKAQAADSQQASARPPPWGSQEPSSPATCDHCGPRPTMLQPPDALGVPPVPQGQCGTKHQGKLTRPGRRDGNTCIPVRCSYLSFSPFCSTSAGMEATPAWQQLGSLTQEEDRPQLGCAGADVSHLAEPAARRRVDNAVVTQICCVQSAVHI